MGKITNSEQNHSELFIPWPDKKSIILMAILFAAFLLRLIHWLDVHHDPFFAQLIMDSQEYDRWAMEILSGNWLGSQVFFQAPLYPYWLALIFTLFGHSLDAVYLIQILGALVGYYALYRAGEKIGGEKVGLAATFLAAFYGVFIFYDVQILKESLAVTLVCWLLWVLLEARQKESAILWLTAGWLSGLLCLLRENMLIVVLFLLPLAYRKGGKLLLTLKKSSLLLLGVIMVLLPVAWRNWIVGDVFLPTTFQGGVNFYIGNNPHATGTYQPIVPGKEIPYYERTEPIRVAEQEMGRHLSPAEVSNFWLKKALAWAKANPLDFVRLQFKKFLMFWSWYEWPDAVDYYYVKKNSLILKLPLFEFGGIFLLALIGLWLWRKRLKKLLVVGLFLCAWMVSTIIFFLFSRYRLPALPALILLAALALASLGEAWEKRNWKKALFLTGLVFLSLFAPRSLGYQPRMDLVHYNLGLVFERLGQLDKAASHYQQAIASNSNDFLSMINLGNILARRNNWSAALDWYQKAAATEPRAEGAQVNLGRAYILLGNLEKAESHLRKALKINPQNIEALQNLTVLLAKKGLFQEALKTNQRVIQLAPGWPPALRLRAKLLKLASPQPKEKSGKK